ncbi:MAG: LptF/LptG family permease [Myxococcota bacterium]
MRIARTLSVYVMRETLLYCGLTFVVITLVLLTQNVLRRLDTLVTVGMTGADLLTAVLCILPIALSYAIPLAFLVGTLLAIRRLASDGELLAFRASGFGPTAFLTSFLLLGLVASALSGWLLGSVEHRARRDLVELVERMAARGAVVEAGKFRHTGSQTIFVEDRDREGALRGVMIYDQSRPEAALRIFAARGEMAFDEAERAMHIELENGEIHVEPRADAPDRYERMRFESFSYRIDLRHLLSRQLGPVRPKQMSVTELERVLARAAAGDPLMELDEKDPREYALEIHRRRALPFAPLLFAGLGVPIALASEHRRRHLGLLLGLLAAFAYYGVGSATESLALAGRLEPATALWLPNGLAAVAALVLILRGRDRIPA